MEKFFAEIEKFTQLSDEGKNALASVMYRLELPKGKILVEPDSICQNVYFVEKGLTRTYYYKDGKDVTDWLSPENSFVVSIVSFLTQVPDRRAVELLEPSVLWALPFRELEGLYARSHEIERLGRLLISHGLIMLQHRFDELHFAGAAERYARLLRMNPGLVQRVPLGIIASYLGISQETLSRIRSQH